MMQSTVSLGDPTWTVANTSWVTENTRNDSAILLPPEGCVVLSVMPGDFIPWDNPDNLISREVEMAVDAAVGALLLPILFIISAGTNVLNMLVFCRQGLKERINLCLFSLSLADCLYMLHSFVYNVDKIYSQFTEVSGVGVVFEFVVNNHLMFIRGMSWLSGFLSMMIACERCFCVHSPLRSQELIKTRTCGVIILVAAVLLLGLLYIGGSVRWGVSCVFDPLSNSTSKMIYPSKFYIEHQELVDIITGVVSLFLLPVIYMSVISTTTILTFVKLRKVAAWREQTSSATMSSREVALTRMLIGISVLYVVCSVPLLVLSVSVLFIPDMSLQGRYYNTFNLFVSFFELFSYVNASFNFFVYSFLGSKFRDTLKELCCLGCRSVRVNEKSMKRKSAINTSLNK